MHVACLDRATRDARGGAPFEGRRTCGRLRGVERALQVAGPGDVDVWGSAHPIQVPRAISMQSELSDPNPREPNRSRSMP